MSPFLLSFLYFYLLIVIYTLFSNIFCSFFNNHNIKNTNFESLSKLSKTFLLIKSTKTKKAYSTGTDCIQFQAIQNTNQQSAIRQPFRSDSCCNINYKNAIFNIQTILFAYVIFVLFDKYYYIYRCGIIFKEDNEQSYYKNSRLACNLQKFFVF